MNERQIDESEAVDILSLWHKEERPVEVILRFGQGLTQSHPGRVTIQPEGQLVVADITDRDHYLSTILDIFCVREHQTVGERECDDVRRTAFGSRQVQLRYGCVPRTIDCFHLTPRLKQTTISAKPACRGREEMLISFPEVRSYGR
jgi:hypothetical protein